MLLFVKKTDLCFPLPQRFQKTFAHKSIKNFSQYICRQLQQHQYKIRSKTGISLKITLNVFKCLIVFLVSVKLLIWQQHFSLFQLVYSVCEFAMMPGVHILLSPHEKKQEVHSSSWRAQISSIFIKKTLTFVCHYIIMARSLLNWKKIQTRNLTVFMVLVI